MILVTGASGTVGGELVQQLLAQGKAVRVFTRDPNKLAQLGTQVEYAAGDLDEPESVAAALAGATRVFLVTASAQQDETVLAAARRAGVRHIVKLSTLEAGHEPMLGHGQRHREREQRIEASGLDWTFLRPTMFMSSALEWAAGIKVHGVVAYPG